MKMDEKTKDQFKTAIITASEEQYTELMSAKENLKVIVTSIKDTFGADTKLINKFIKYHYDSSIEEEKANMENTYKLYKEIFG